MSETVYDVDYFLRKFEAIPDEKWCECLYVTNDGKRCALAHCFPEGVTASAIENYDRDSSVLTLEADALIKLIKGQLGYSVEATNNGFSVVGIPEIRSAPTPKARLLVALNIIKKATP